MTGDLLELLGDWENEPLEPRRRPEPRPLEFTFPSELHGGIGQCRLCGHGRPLHGPFGAPPIPCTWRGCRCATLAGAA